MGKVVTVSGTALEREVTNLIEIVVRFRNVLAISKTLALYSLFFYKNLFYKNMRLKSDQNLRIYRGREDRRGTF